jgi:hypothetical protein
MALVANPLPIDTMTAGKTVCYFDPTADMAGLKYGTIKSVAYGVSGTNEPMTLTVTPDIAGADVVGAARFFRVVDEFLTPPARRVNV